MKDVTVTTNLTHDVLITQCADGFAVGITEAPVGIDVQVHGTVSSAGIDPLSGLGNLTNLYEVAKL